VVLSDAKGPRAVWTGSTNWSTTGLCTQVNNGLLVAHTGVADRYRKQWDRLREASPPSLRQQDSLLTSLTPTISHFLPQSDTRKITVWFTRTSDGRDMDELRESYLQLRINPVPDVYSWETGPTHSCRSAPPMKGACYVRGVFSTWERKGATTTRTCSTVELVSSDQNFKPDHYTVIQPQGIDVALGPWVAEVTRRDFCRRLDTAIVHSKVLVI